MYGFFYWGRGLRLINVNLKIYQFRQWQNLKGVVWYMMHNISHDIVKTW